METLAGSQQERPITHGHAGGASTVFHIAQIRSKMVRINHDAPQVYAKDPRWQSATDMERAFGVRTLTHLAGNVYRVFDTMTDDYGTFYYLHLVPTITVPDPQGIQQRMNAFFIHRDYVTVIDTGFLEAR